MKLKNCGSLVEVHKATNCHFSVPLFHLILFQLSLLPFPTLPSIFLNSTFPFLLLSFSVYFSYRHFACYFSFTVFITLSFLFTLFHYSSLLFRLSFSYSPPSSVFIPCLYLSTCLRYHVISILLPILFSLFLSPSFSFCSPLSLTLISFSYSLPSSIFVSFSLSVYVSSISHNFFFLGFLSFPSSIPFSHFLFLFTPFFYLNLSLSYSICSSVFLLVL